VGEWAVDDDEGLDQIAQVGFFVLPFFFFFRLIDDVVAF